MFLRGDTRTLLKAERYVMDADAFTYAYLRFCLKHGYRAQAGATNLPEMMDTLILSAVRVLGPLPYVGPAPVRLDDWQPREHEAKKLFKHGFHLNNGLTVMTHESLIIGGEYFFERANELTAIQPALAASH